MGLEYSYTISNFGTCLQQLMNIGSACRNWLNPDWQATGLQTMPHEVAHDFQT